MYQSVHASLAHWTLFYATEFRNHLVSAVSCSPPPFHLFFGRFCSSTLSTSRYASPETPLLFGERLRVCANVALIELEDQVGGEIREIPCTGFSEDNRIRLRGSSLSRLLNSFRFILQVPLNFHSKKGSWTCLFTFEL